jgi:hypothetical protein
MKRIWEWLSSNTAALGGLASIIVILGALVVIPGYLNRFFSADLIFRVNHDQTTLPPDLKEWLSEIGHTVWLNKKLLSSDENINQELAAFLHNPVVKKLQKFELRRDFDRLTLAIVNQSTNVVSGLRLRLDRVSHLWGVEITGTFIAPNEQASIRNQIIDGYKDQTIIVPSLPPIPKNSSLEISLYGSLEFSEPTLNVIGSSMTLRNVVEIDEGWIVYWLKNPLQFKLYMVSLLFILISFLAIAGIPIWHSVTRRIVIKEEKNILYNSACSTALEGRIEDAMVLLRQAVTVGYSNFEHARNDNDLRALRDRADFEELFSCN